MAGATREKLTTDPEIEGLLDPLTADEEKEVYLRTQRAIQAFCADEPISRLHTPRIPIYALPPSSDIEGG